MQEELQQGGTTIRLFRENDPELLRRSEARRIAYLKARDITVQEDDGDTGYIPLSTSDERKPC